MTTRLPAARGVTPTIRPGEKIDHRDGMTVEEAEHQIATRLYQNTARVHFNQFTEGKGRFGRRLIYGGHVISLARALQLQRARQRLSRGGDQRRPACGAAIRGMHRVRLERGAGAAEIPKRKDVGALRLRTIATKDKPCADFPGRQGEEYDPAVILDLDYWALIPR